MGNNEFLGTKSNQLHRAIPKYSVCKKVINSLSFIPYTFYHLCNVLFMLNCTTHSSVLLLCVVQFNVNKTLYQIVPKWVLLTTFTMRINLPKTLDQLIFCIHCILNKFTKYLVNVLKFTKYLVNSYHQKGVKHYVLTNWYQMTPI